MGRHDGVLKRRECKEVPKCDKVGVNTQTAKHPKIENHSSHTGEETDTSYLEAFYVFMDCSRSPVLTCALMVASSPFLLAVATYQAGPACKLPLNRLPCIWRLTDTGDDFAFGKWLESVFGLFMYPSTSGFVFAWVMSVLAAGAAVSTLPLEVYPRTIIEFLCEWMVSKLLLHGVVEAMKALPSALLIALGLCQAYVSYQLCFSECPGRFIKGWRNKTYY